jgi:hypothetical protein
MGPGLHRMKVEEPQFEDDLRFTETFVHFPPDWQVHEALLHPICMLCCQYIVKRDIV